MKNLTLLSLFLACTSCGKLAGQYYYKDIIGTRETVNQMKLYKANQVKQVSLKSIDAEGMYVEGFAAGQVISPDFRHMTTVTRSERTEPSFIVSYFDEKGMLLRTIDSAENLSKTGHYTYFKNGSLASIVYWVKDSAEETKAEEHQWFYNAAGQPEKMLRINDTDSTLTEFVLDDAGNVAEEKSTRRGIGVGEPYYYYYDDQHRLTDIVRYNRRADKLLPDYMFEYSESNQVIQMITIPNNSPAYLIWRYQYDTNGLKIREACFGKDKELIGKIEYTYSMGR